MSYLDFINIGIDELAKREARYEKALTRWAEAEHAYRQKRAKHFLLSEGSVQARTHESEVACEAEMLEKLQAEAEKESSKVLLEDCRTVISARKIQLEVESRLTGQ